MGYFTLDLLRSDRPGMVIGFQRIDIHCFVQSIILQYVTCSRKTGNKSERLVSNFESNIYTILCILYFTLILNPKT